MRTVAILLLISSVAHAETIVAPQFAGNDSSIVQPVFAGDECNSACTCTKCADGCKCVATGKACDSECRCVTSKKPVKQVWPAPAGGEWQVHSYRQSEFVHLRNGVQVGSYNSAQGYYQSYDADSDTWGEWYYCAPPAFLTKRVVAPVVHAQPLRVISGGFSGGFGSIGAACVGGG